MEKLKTYVINLPKDLDRRESILKETGQIPWLDVEMTEAVYGKELTEEERSNSFNSKKFTQYYGRMVLPGEIGCTLSHRLCYQRLLNSDQSFALILEDDAHFVETTFTEYFFSSVTEFMNNPLPRVLLLHANFEYTGKKLPFGDNYHLYSVYSALYTTGYIINKSAAYKLLQEKYPYWAADNWHLFRKWGLPIYSLYPSVVIQQWDKLKSSIVENKLPDQKKRLFPHCWIECGLAYNRLCYILQKRLGIIKSIQD